MGVVLSLVLEELRALVIAFWVWMQVAGCSSDLWLANQAVGEFSAAC